MTTSSRCCPKASLHFSSAEIDSADFLGQLIPDATFWWVKHLRDKRYKHLAPRLKVLDEAQELVHELV